MGVVGDEADGFPPEASPVRVLFEVIDTQAASVSIAASREVRMALTTPFVVVGMSRV